MDNFFSFNKTANPNPTPINEQYNGMKDNYEQIFTEAAESIRAAIDKFKPENPCTLCAVKDCKIQNKDVFTDFPAGCAYREWQLQVLAFLNGDYRQKLKNTYKMIMDKKENYHCIKCGNCCRLATSEFSYDQLKQRAARGDKFARDFVSVFEPYENEKEAKLANPEFFDLLNEVMGDQKVFYYYCPKLFANECSDYENRPDVCKNFPHNPLKLLPSSCSFNAWKNEVSYQSMLLKAKTDIIDFYKNKLG